MERKFCKITVPPSLPAEAAPARDVLNPEGRATACSQMAAVSSFFRDIVDKPVSLFRRNVIQSAFPPQLSSSPSAFSYHPDKRLLAVALKDDTVGFVEVVEKSATENRERGSPSFHKLVLKEPSLMINIRDVCVDPVAGKLVAVACPDGICLWQIRAFDAFSAFPKSPAEREKYIQETEKLQRQDIPRNSTPLRGRYLSERSTSPLSCASILAGATLVYLSHPFHENISSVSFSPCGMFLASASKSAFPGCPTLLIWDLMSTISAAAPSDLKLSAFSSSSHSFTSSCSFAVHASGDDTGLPSYRPLCGSFYVPWLGGQGIGVLEWSPDGHFLLAASSMTGDFDVFRASDWSKRSYQTGNGKPMRTAVWRMPQAHDVSTTLGSNAKLLTPGGRNVPTGMADREAETTITLFFNAQNSTTVHMMCFRTNPAVIEEKVFSKAYIPATPQVGAAASLLASPRVPMTQSQVVHRYHEAGALSILGEPYRPVLDVGREEQTKDEPSLWADVSISTMKLAPSGRWLALSVARCPAQEGGPTKEHVRVYSVQLNLLIASVNLVDIIDPPVDIIDSPPAGNDCARSKRPYRMQFHPNPAASSLLTIGWEKSEDASAPRELTHHLLNRN